MTDINTTPIAEETIPTTIEETVPVVETQPEDTPAIAAPETTEEVPATPETI